MVFWCSLAKLTYKIYQDNKLIKEFNNQKSDFCVLKFMLDNQGNSMDYAFKYGGYSATVTDQKTNIVHSYN